MIALLSFIYIGNNHAVNCLLNNSREIVCRFDRSNKNSEVIQKIIACISNITDSIFLVPSVVLCIGNRIR